MTLRQKAYAMIDSLPDDDSIRFFIDMIRQFNTEVQLKRPGREFPVLFCFFLSEIFAGFLKNFLNAPLHTVVCRRLCYNRNDQGIQGGIKMAVSSIKVYFQSDLEWVWDVVTSLEDTAWRKIGRAHV